MKKKKVFNPQVLKSFRILKGVTQTEVAKDLEITPRTIRNYELGQTAPWTSKNTKDCNIHQIASYFETDVNVFYLSDEEFANLLKRQTQLPDFVCQMHEEMLTRYFHFINSPNHREVHTALHIRDRLIEFLSGHWTAPEPSEAEVQDTELLAEGDVPEAFKETKEIYVEQG